MRSLNSKTVFQFNFMKTAIFSACIIAACFFFRQADYLLKRILHLTKTAKSTELSIPASPAFNMLNENVPSRIQRYASLQRFQSGLVYDQWPTGLYSKPLVLLWRHSLFGY